jgi:hypothetical protein
LSSKANTIADAIEHFLKLKKGRPATVAMTCPSRLGHS